MGLQLTHHVHDVFIGEFEGIYHFCEMAVLQINSRKRWDRLICMMDWMHWCS